MSSMPGFARAIPSSSTCWSRATGRAARGPAGAAATSAIGPRAATSTSAAIPSAPPCRARAPGRPTSPVSRRPWARWPRCTSGRTAVAVSGSMSARWKRWPPRTSGASCSTPGSGSSNAAPTTGTPTRRTRSRSSPAATAGSASRRRARRSGATSAPRSGCRRWPMIRATARTRPAPAAPTTPTRSISAWRRG